VILQADLQLPRDLGAKAISPGGLNQDPPGMGIAALGDATLLLALSAGVFRWRQANEVHQRAGMGETAQIAQLGHQGDGRKKADPAQHGQELHQWIPTPGLRERLQLALQVLQALMPFRDHVDVVLIGDFLGRFEKMDVRQMTLIGVVPVLPAGTGMTIAQQEGLEPLAGLAQIEHGVLTAADQIANGLIVGIGDVNGLDKARLGQPCQGHGIAPISFDPVARRLGDKGGCHDPTLDALLDQMAIQPVTARPRLVDDAAVAGLLGQVTDEFIDGADMGGDGTVEGNGPIAARGKRHIGGVFVNIETQEKRARVRHVDLLLLLWLVT